MSAASTQTRLTVGILQLLSLPCLCVCLNTLVDKYDPADMKHRVVS